MSDQNKKEMAAFCIFLATFASSFFFLAGAVLYLVLAVAGLDYEKDVDGVPAEVLDADDDYTFYTYVYDYSPGYTDDCVFHAKNADVWVSYYQIIYFAAALCFVFTGLIDIFFVPGLVFGLTMFFAGVFGVLSAMFVEEDENLSDIFNLVSVHLFVLEAVQLVVYRESYPGLNFWLRLGDVTFLLATMMDVGLSYAYVADISLEAMLPLAKVEIFSALLWFPQALVYMFSTVYIYRQSGFEDTPSHRRYSTVAYGKGGSGIVHKDTENKESFEETSIFEDVEVISSCEA